MSDEMDELREEMLSKSHKPLVLVDSKAERIITTAENMHELALQVRGLKYDEDQAILFTPWSRQNRCIDIQVEEDINEL